MSVVLEYPPASPTNTVTLPSPMLGDSYINKNKANIHVAMSGATVATKRTPTRQKLLMRFLHATDTEYDDLKTFLGVVKGRDVRLTGFGGDMWVGKIVTNPLSAEHIAEDRVSFVLELIGIRSNTAGLLLLEDSSGYLQLEDGNYLLFEEETG